MGKELFIRVPASSANLGPGFDALSLGIGVYLNIKVTIGGETAAPVLSLSYDGVNASNIAVEIEANLIGKTILHVVSRAGGVLPNNEIKITVQNDIPLSKGLGSSAAAVVAVANELCNFKLSKLQLLKHALEIENHPDNLSAALFGGFVVSCVDENGDCIALSTEVSKESKQIQATIIVPNIEKKSTAEARAVLPPSYSRAEVVFNIQRVSLLTSLFSKPQQIDSAAKVFATAMQDKIHQPKQLVPGLEEILSLSSTLPHSCKSFLGVSMSGAGPSVLLLSLNSDDNDRKIITSSVQDCFAKHNVTSVPYLVEIDNVGTWWEWK